MEFKTATEGIPADVLARAFRVSRQSIWQYRLDPSSDGYRSPPTGWEHVVARILQNMGSDLQERAGLLMAPD